MDDPGDNKKYVTLLQEIILQISEDKKKKAAYAEAVADNKEEHETSMFDFSHFDLAPENCIYKGEQSFETLAEKMENVTDNGLIKKFILKQGYFEKVPQKATVTIQYKGFYEYYNEPFYSTYRDKQKMLTFTLDNEGNIPGFDIAILTMKIAEKSQFIIPPQYSRRSPLLPNEPILYEIEVINYIKADTKRDIPKSGPPNERDFCKLERYLHAQCTKAGDLFMKDAVQKAIKIYSETETMLEDSYVYDNAEWKRHQQLLLKILTNLVVCYAKAHLPKRTCTSANKIYRICKEESFKVPIKVHYNHGLSLIELGDYYWAERKLKQAERLLPKNYEIKRTLQILYNQQNKYFTDDNVDIALRPVVYNVSSELKVFMTEHCLSLLRDPKNVPHRLPNNFTDIEIRYCKAEAKKHGLILVPPKKYCDDYILKKLV